MSDAPQARKSLFGRALRVAGGPRPLLAGCSRRPSDHVIAVVARENPSFDYYLAPRLAAAAAGKTFEVVDLATPALAALGGVRASGAYVLLCRYANGDWMRALERRRSSLAGVGLFVDDDVEAVVDDPEAPLSYRVSLFRRHLAHRAALGRVLDRVFVSTRALAARCASARPVVIGPTPSPQDSPPSLAGQRSLRVCFHATGAHVSELRWAMPLLETLAARRRDVEFEVVVDLGRAAAAGASGVVVRPFVPWPQYRRDTATRGASLLLVPLLDKPANRSRSATKRIDAARMGAAILTNAEAIYRPDPDEAALGMSAPLDHGAWLARVLDLLDSPERLARLADLNARHVARWTPDKWRMLFGHDEEGQALGWSQARRVSTVEEG